METDEVRPKAGRVRRTPSMTSTAAMAIATASEPITIPAAMPEEALPAMSGEAARAVLPAVAEVEIALVDAATVPLEDAAAEAPEMMEAVTSPAVRSDPTPVADASTQIEQGTSDMATMAPPVNETTEKAQAMLGEMQGRMKSALEKSTKMGEDMVDFAKGNVEAMMASARAAAKASESLSQEAADYSRKSLEHATSMFKSFSSAKSPTELFQLQSDYAKASFDNAVAEASKMSEAMMKFAGEIAQPLSNRYAMAAEKFKAIV